MIRTIRQSLLLIACFIVVHTAATQDARGEGEDTFINAAFDPLFYRDAHGIATGGHWISSAGTNDGQHTGMSFAHLGVASDLWYDERNEVLGGVQYTSRFFDHRIVLPGGAILPERIDAPSAALIYKHITSGDWSLTQSVRYTHFVSDDQSTAGAEGFDLIGLAAVSREPGTVWLSGYIWNQTGYLFKKPTPLIEYAYVADEEFTFIIGFPVEAATYRPHPDWTLSLNWDIGDVPSISAVYQVAKANTLRLSYGGHEWVCRLDGHDDNVTYKARRLALEWTRPYLIFRKGIMVNAEIGREMDRRLGSGTKLSLGDATIIGLNVTFGF